MFTFEKKASSDDYEGSASISLGPPPLSDPMPLVDLVGSKNELLLFKEGSKNLQHDFFSVIKAELLALVAS